MVLTRWTLMALVALGMASTTATAQEPRGGLLAQVGAYVDAWERELGSVVADEDYQQTVKCWRSLKTDQPDAVLLIED